MIECKEIQWFSFRLDRIQKTSEVLKHLQTWNMKNISQRYLKRSEDITEVSRMTFLNTLELGISAIVGEVHKVHDYLDRFILTQYINQISPQSSPQNKISHKSMDWNLNFVCFAPIFLSNQRHRAPPPRPPAPPPVPPRLSVQPSRWPRSLGRPIPGLQPAANQAERCVNRNFWILITSPNKHISPKTMKMFT